MTVYNYGHFSIYSAVWAKSNTCACLGHTYNNYYTKLIEMPLVLIMSVWQAVIMTSIKLVWQSVHKILK